MTQKAKDGAVQHIRNAVVSRREGESIFRRGISALTEKVATAETESALADSKAIAQSNFERGEFSFEKHNYEEAVRWYRLAAQQGHSKAQLALAKIYFDGLVPGNIDEASKWCHLAAEQGLASAQGFLGWMYSEGEGVAMDDAEAVKWHCLAAQQGYVPSQVELSHRYSDGRGVPQNDSESAKWCHLAAEQGDVFSQATLGENYRSGRGVKRDATEAVKWYRLTAEQGVGSALFSLAEMYCSGEGVPKNIVAGYAIYSLAATSPHFYRALPSVRKIYNTRAMACLESLSSNMTTREMKLASDLTFQMAKRGNLLKALDDYTSREQTPT
jgi:TPR repeat protein